MTPADHARNQAISLEAKKDALAQRQNGDWKVSFTVQGIDMDVRLTQAPMGTRYAVVLVEIGDDELPAQQKEAPSNVPSGSPPSTRPDGTKRDWRDVQPAAQAVLRSKKPEFWAFLREETEFNDVRNENQAATAIRNICQVDSRSELSTDHRKRVLWHQLDSQFQAWQAKERVGA
jgi:hypothetical protein